MTASAGHSKSSAPKRAIYNKRRMANGELRMKINLLTGSCLCLIISVLSPKILLAETLVCAVESYAHAGFSSTDVAESWFPRVTTHVLKNGSATLVEQDLSGSYKERGGRLKITYEAEDVDGNPKDILYTFIEKTSVFTAKLLMESGFADTSGTVGKCRLQ